MNDTITSEQPTAGKMALDVRGLPPPEPMQRVMEALAELAPGSVLVVQIHREPVFLFDLITPGGWRHSGRQLGADHWEIRIWRTADET